LVQIPNVGSELVYNGDFQIGGTPPAGWITTGAGALTGETFGPYGDGISGRWLCVSLPASSNIYTAVANRFALVAGAGYTFRWAYKRTSGNITSSYILGPGLTAIKLYDALPGGTGTWLTDTKSFVPAQSCAAAYFNIGNVAGLDVDLGFDNVSIRRDTP
jgi:hypothetical protein